MPTQTVNNNWARWLQNAQRLVAPLAARLAAVPVRRWQMAIMLLLGALILADLARLVWLAVPVHNAPPVTAAPINVAAAPAAGNAGTVDIDKMTAWHLFGEAGAQSQPQQHVTALEEQAQDTTLKLQLLGVIVASDTTQARAFILGDGRQQQFALGEQLPGPGKVLLRKVLVDRVIIDNNGRLETLWLYDPNASTQLRSAPDSAAAQPTTVDMRANPGVSQLVKGYRDRLYQNPGSLADVIQVSPASEDGRLIGYRVNPGREPAQFAKLGLKPGDIVTSINDVRLDDPQRALELYKTLRTQTEASITVRRGNEDVVLMVSLQGNNSD